MLKSDIGEVYARARVVRNTVEPDPNMPTIEEVRALLDEPSESEELEVETPSPSGETSQPEETTEELSDSS